MSEHEELDCHVIYTRMHAFFDGELDHEMWSVVQTHLEGCEPCVEIYDIEEKMRITIRRSCSQAAPSDLRSRIETLRATICRSEGEA